MAFYLVRPINRFCLFDNLFAKAYSTSFFTGMLFEVLCYVEQTQIFVFLLIIVDKLHLKYITIQLLRKMGAKGIKVTVDKALNDVV